MTSSKGDMEDPTVNKTSNSASRKFRGRSSSRGRHKNQSNSNNLTNTNTMSNSGNNGKSSKSSTDRRSNTPSSGRKGLLKFLPRTRSRDTSSTPTRPPVVSPSNSTNNGYANSPSHTNQRMGRSRHSRRPSNNNSNLPPSHSDKLSKTFSDQQQQKRERTTIQINPKSTPPNRTSSPERTPPSPSDILSQSSSVDSATKRHAHTNAMRRCKKLHSENEKDGFCRRVDYYDGQTISVDGKPTYEVGNYLGGGVAGVVYEGTRSRPRGEYPDRAGMSEVNGGDGNNAQHEGLNDDGTANTHKLKEMLDAQNEESQRSSNRCVENNFWCGSGSAENDLDYYDSEDEFDRGDLELEDENDTVVKDAATNNKEKEDDETVAIKVLNPVSFRLLSATACATAVIVKKGAEMGSSVVRGHEPMGEEHVWWIVNPSSKNLRSLKREPSPLVIDRRDGAAVGTTLNENAKRNMSGPTETSTMTDMIDRGSEERGLRLSLVAAYREPSSGKIRELPLSRCIEIWGHAPFGASEDEFEQMMDSIERVNAGLSNQGSSSINDNDDSPPQSNNNNNNTPENRQPSPSSSMFTKDSGLYRATVAKSTSTYCEELNAYIAVSKVPPKYLRWLRQRRAATKEIRNMMRIGRHKNVVHLYEVLEFVQDNKSIMFLVLELVRGGELFDLISSNNATQRSMPDTRAIAHLSESEQTEYTMRKFFRELASGVAYCHANGIAHRDLKPENLLVHTEERGRCTLKIADFGLSATFAIEDDDNSSNSRMIYNDGTSTPKKSYGSNGGPPSPGPVTGLSPLLTKNFSSMLTLLTCGGVEHISDCFQPRTAPPSEGSSLERMTSIVGSPHYVAPEIISQSDDKNSTKKGSTTTLTQNGYDGTKADVWSAGVILYAMLFRSLPFGEDLLRCPRYQSFTKWYSEARKMRGRRMSSEAALEPLGEEDEGVDSLGPHWFFPSSSSRESKDIIVAMLNPNPWDRLSVRQVLRHPWMRLNFRRQ